MRKKFIIVFAILILASVIIGIYLRPHYNNKKPVYDMENASLKVDLETSVGELMYTDKSNYTNSFNTEIVARVQFKSRKISGGKVIANVQVKEVYLGNISQKNINILENIEYSIEDNKTVILSQGLYVPMQQNKEYIVNIEKVASNLYLFTTLDFSCYMVSDNHELIEVDETYNTITPDVYNKDIILTLSKDYTSMVGSVSIDEYINIRNLSIENARKYMLDK